MNNIKNRKITLLEALIFYVVMTYTPNIRFITKTATKNANQAAWLVPFASLILFVPLVLILLKIFKKYKNQSFDEVVCRVFGKPIGKAISAITLIWLLILLGLYIKYAGEKLVSSVYVGADLRVLILLIVVIVAVFLRWGIHVLTRISKVLFISGLIQFLLLCGILMFMDFSIENITPINTPDITSALSSAVYPMTIFVYITFLFIFRDQIEFGKKPGRKFVYVIAFEVLATTLIILSILGVFGYELTNKLSFPFLSAVRNIQISDGSTGLESLFVAIWLLMEFITISYFAYIISRLVKNIFHLNNQTPALTAVMGFGYFFAIYICDDVFELVKFSENIAVPINLALGLGIPVVLFVTAKIRKIL